MMNILALAYLASCLTGLVVVVPPEPLDIHQQPASSYEGPHLLRSAKDAAKRAAQHVLCDQPPCPPTALDNLKDTLHHGYQKTADSLEGAKEFVSDHIEAAKESAERAYHHVKGTMHDTTERAKQGTHETVERAKQGVQDRADKVKHGMQDTAEKAKHGVRATADMATSFIPGKDKKEREDPDSYIMPGVSKSMENLKRTFDDEKHELYTLIKDSPAMESLKRKANEASGYIPTGRKIEDGIEGVKKGVKEMVSRVQDKASDVFEHASDVVHDVQDKAGNIITGKLRDKAGNIITGKLSGIKEKFIPHTQPREVGDGLELKVHELCSMVGVERTKTEGGAHMIDTAPLRESYGYLMESATRAIDSAKDIFEKAIEGEGAEWKEKYLYLADSAKGALEGAKDVFDRAITSMEDDIKQRQNEANDNVKAGAMKKHLTSGLKEAVTHTKQRLSVSFRSLVRTFYLASFSVAFGVTLWTTFCSGHLLSRALPRQQLAIVQSKLFPAYLRVVTGCLTACTIGHMMLHPWPSVNWWEHLQNWNFSFSLVVSLCNMIWLEPKVTKVMFEKLKFEREEARGQSGDSNDEATLARLTSMDTKFKALHQLTSFANLVIIAGLIWHLWYLAHRLVM